MNALDRAEEAGRVAFTITEAATALSLGKSTAYRMAENGDIPTIRIGRRLVVPIAALRELLLPHSTATAQDACEDS